MEPDLASLVFLTPYALVGWIVGPFAGGLAPTIGYRAILRVGLVGSIVATLLMAFVGVHSLPVLVAATVLIGITYAGIANIILNGLGIVLSPASNPGFLPGLNAGAFNLGAGVSFAVLPALQIALGVGGSSGTAGLLRWHAPRCRHHHRRARRVVPHPAAGRRRDRPPPPPRRRPSGEHDRRRRVAQRGPGGPDRALPEAR